MIATREEVVGVSYASGSGRPLGREQWRHKLPAGWAVLNLSRRDGQSCLVSCRTPRGSAFRVLDSQGHVCGEAESPRVPEDAGGIEGTPIVYTLYRGQLGKIQVAFDMMLQGQPALFRPIRVARGTAEELEGGEFSNYSAICLTGVPTLALKRPVVTQKQLMKLSLEGNEAGRAYMVSVLHLSEDRRTVVYRDLVFKMRSASELTAEVTKTLQVGLGARVSRCFPLSCASPPGSCLYNSFGVLLESGELQLFTFNQSVPKLVQRTQLFSSGVSVGAAQANFAPSMLLTAAGEDLLLLGVDGQYNEPKALEKLRQDIARLAAPQWAVMRGYTEESARQMLLHQLPAPPGTAGRLLVPLMRASLQFAVSCVSTDGKVLLVGGTGRVVAFSLDQLRTQSLYDYYCRAGDLFQAAKETAPELESVLDSIRAKMMGYEPCQQYLLSSSAAESFSTSGFLQRLDPIRALSSQKRLKAGRGTQRAASTVRGGLSAAAGVAFAGEGTVEDALSALRNSGAVELNTSEGPSFEDETEISEDSLEMVGTRTLIRRGEELAAGSGKAADLQEAVEDLIASRSQLGSLWAARQVLEPLRLEFPALGSADDASNYMRALYARRAQSPLIQGLSEALDGDASVQAALSCQFDGEHLVNPSGDSADQQFYQGNQLFRLLETRLRSSVLFSCGHETVREGSLISFSTVDIRGVLDGWFARERASLCPECGCTELQEAVRDVRPPAYLLMRAQREEGPSQALPVRVREPALMYSLCAAVSADGAWWIQEQGCWLDQQGALGEPSAEWWVYAAPTAGLEVSVTAQTLISLLELAGGDGEAQRELLMEAQQRELRLREELEVARAAEKEFDAEISRLRKVQEANGGAETKRVALEAVQLRQQLQLAQQEVLCLREAEEESKRAATREEGLRKALQQCFEALGEKNVPKYVEDMVRKLESSCIRLAAEKDVLRTSMARSQEVQSPFKARRCQEALLPALAGVFAVVLVVLFALVLADGGVV